MIVVLGIVVLLLLYMLMIMPRIVNKPDITSLEGWLYAHRGLHNNETEAPENSMAAFQKAVEAGYGIELDIQLTRDKEVVVFHDGTLNRVCGIEGKVCDYTYEQLQQFCLCGSDEKIPKLIEVLELVNGQVPLIVEFKGENIDLSLCPVADAILREYQGVYCMESFNPLMVAWYRKHHSDIVRGQLAENFWRHGNRKILHWVLQNLLLNFYARPDFIAYNWADYNSMSRILCKKLYGITAVAWTIKNQVTLEKAKKHFDLFIFDSFIPADDVG